MMIEKDDNEFLGPLHTSVGSLKRAATKRRRQYQLETVKKSEAAGYIEEGWELDRELKTKTRLRRPLRLDEILENKVWFLLYLLGYPEINASRNFKIRIDRKGADPLSKQIDVFAKDDETVLVFECKSSSQTAKRSLQKDIEEFASLKGPISNSIKRHYGTEFKPKILWFFVTDNIIWSDPDRQRAAGAKINIITERELRYFLQIADHLRKAARFQFLAEFLKGQKIPELDGVSVSATLGKLGGKKFYAFVSTPRQMLKISFVNHRSLNDPDGIPTYQRLVGRTRLNQISKFIQGGGFFPNNILVNFSSRCRFEKIDSDSDSGTKFGRLYLPNKYRSAWIIDGQHRLYGYAALDDQYLDQNIFVIGFENLKPEEEANLFVEINSQQKPVPKTLLDDLEGELKWGSENPGERIGAISARLVGLLNTDVGEPLYGRVTQQGITPTDSTCLTVPAVKQGMRKSGILGAVYKKKEYQPGPLSGLDDQATLQRAHSVLNSYFSILQDANPRQWKIGKSGYFCTNTAIQGHLLLLGSLIDYIAVESALNPREMLESDLISNIDEYLSPIVNWFKEASDLEIERSFKVQFGSGGPREYYFRLCRIVKDTFSDFTPDGFSEWLSEQSTERIVETDQKLKDLNIFVHKTLVAVLKDVHGADTYWDEGVSDKKMKAKAYEKSLEDDKEVRLSLDNYLDFIEFKKIIEFKGHWENMKPFFNIPEPGEKGFSKNLKWMDRINELRRKPAHATEKRQYKTAEFEYIDFVHEEFFSRIEGLFEDTI